MIRYILTSLIRQTPTQVLYRIYKIELKKVGGECWGTNIVAKQYSTPTWSATSEIKNDPGTLQLIRQRPTLTAPASITLASGNAQISNYGSGAVISHLLATWVHENEDYVYQYEVQIRQTGQTAWGESAFVPVNPKRYTFTGAGIVDGISYDVRVRAIPSTFSVANRSAWRTVTGHTLIGKTAPPQDITRFEMSSLTNGDRFSDWNIDNADPDVRAGGGTRIKYIAGHTAPMTEATWQTMTLLRDVGYSASLTTLEPAAGDFTVAAKFRDSSGIESVNAIWQRVTLGRQNLGDVFHTRSEKAECFNGTPGTNSTRSECRIMGTPTSTWADAAAAGITPANAGNRQWEDVLPETNPAEYTSPVIALEGTRSFFATIGLDIEGTFASANIKYGDTINSSGAIVSPTTRQFTSGTRIRNIQARYYQLYVRVNRDNANNMNAAINDITTNFSTSLATDRYNNLNTNLSTGPQGYHKQTNGRIRLEHRNGADSIENATMTPVQSSRTSTSPATMDITVTNVPNTNPPQIEIQLFDASNRPTQGIVNITIEGPAG